MYPCRGGQLQPTGTPRAVFSGRLRNGEGELMQNVTYAKFECLDS